MPQAHQGVQQGHFHPLPLALPLLSISWEKTVVAHAGQTLDALLEPGGN